MEGIVDWLPYVDNAAPSALQQVEQLVERELLDANLNVVHPGVETLLGSLPVSRFAEPANSTGTKRGLELEQSRIETAKKPCLGIDKTRFDVQHCNTADKRAVLESYLSHEESVLSEILQRTLARQWVANNEYMEGVQDALKEILESQDRNLQDLESHRKLIQSEAQRDLAYMDERWKEALLRNVERALSNAH
ncbi:LAFA_0G10132g1_1 [Lachancea sp. 'fantastica']|nr:LAFA_0G10132g1_1 [Lachancea sp. 'fantastica']